jgi:hypothetical protein
MQRLGRRFASLLALGAILLPGLAWASAESSIADATSRGLAVFVVVTEAGARGTERAVEVANQAHVLAPRSAVVVVDRAVPENAALVQRLRVLGAPLPLVLVMASNGVVAGGALLKDATPQALVAAVPTPRKAQMLLHLSRGDAVFVTIGSEAMILQRGEVFEACNQAMRTLEGKAATVVVDLADEAEAAWLKELGVKADEKVPVTVVFNAKGQKTQVLRGTVTPDQLVQAVHKKVECCPGGKC